MHSAMDGLIFDLSHGLDKLLIAPDHHLENRFCMVCCGWTKSLEWYP